MDGLTPVRGPDPGEFFRNAVRQAGERSKRQAKPHKPHEEPESEDLEPEPTDPTANVTGDMDPDAHGIDLEA